MNPTNVHRSEVSTTDIEAVLEKLVPALDGVGRELSIATLISAVLLIDNPFAEIEPQHITDVSTYITMLRAGAGDQEKVN